MVTVVVLASSVAGSDSTCDAATTGARSGRIGTGACSRTTRMRIPPASTSSSARLCLVASRTTSSTLHGRPPRASGLPDPLLAKTPLPGGDPPQVLAAARVHLDHVPFVEEQRNLDHGAGLERRRLGAAGGGVAANAGIRLRDLKLDEVRQLDGDGVAIDEEDIDFGVLLYYFTHLADARINTCALATLFQTDEGLAVVLAHNAVVNA